MKDLKDFLKHTVVSGECLLWTRCINTDGYPRASYKGSSNGKVHRIVYELATGEDITGKVVRHSCDNPLCINPDHLQSGTPIENMKDRRERGRTYNHVSEEEILEVHSLRMRGLLFREISTKLNISIKRVEYILHKYSL